jgi:hypothetical protein
MKTLLETGQFSTAGNAKVLLELFGDFGAEKFARFAKLVSILLSSTSKFGLSLASSVSDFAVVRLSGTLPPFNRAVALSLFGDLLEISNNFVQIAVGLVNGCDVPFGADFLPRVAEHFPDDHYSEIFACIPKFMELLGRMSAICEILSLYDIRDNTSQVAEMSLGCDDELVGVLSQSVLLDVGVLLFDRIANLLTNTMDAEAFGNCLIALKGSGKKYRVKFETCQALVDSLINGRDLVLPEIAFLDDDPNFFGFLKTFIKNSRRQQSPITCS